MHTRDRIIDVYGPQLGEMAWHSLHADSGVAQYSDRHAASILEAARFLGKKLTRLRRPIRILEVGAYAHYGAHKAAASVHGLSVAHDVSPTSLRVGLEAARQAGVSAEATLVAGDFHDLPFSTGYFDLVFCASSVHHTYRPWRVLQEMLRVLRPRGVLRLENEPVGRACCFYAFRANREDSYTPAEAEMSRRGLLWTISSPFPGSRPEQLFGMIENDRIPLDMFVDTLTAEGDIAALTLAPQVSDFEREIVGLPGNGELEAAIAGRLFAAIDEIRPMVTERDRLIGVNLPDADKIWHLSYRLAPRLRRLAWLEGVAAAHETARLFGAALQLVVVKGKHGEQSDEMFRRQLRLRDRVLDDLPRLPGIDLDVTEHPMPAIEHRDTAELAHVYPASDWLPFEQDDGIRCLLNLCSQCRIAVPEAAAPAMLLLRFYAVGAGEPYKVSLCVNQGAEVASVDVVASESFLFRELVPPGCSEVFIETRAAHGALVDLPHHVRLGVGRMIPIRTAAMAGPRHDEQ